MMCLTPHPLGLAAETYLPSLLSDVTVRPSLWLFSCLPVCLPVREGKHTKRHGARTSCDVWRCFMRLSRRCFNAPRYVMYVGK